MRSPRPRAFLGMLTALVLIACTAQPTPDPSTPPPVAADAVRDVNPQPRDRVRDGGLLRFPITALPAQWNPRHPGASPDTAHVLAPLSPTHLRLDAAGRASANPDFITRITVSHTDRTTVTLQLHERAVWGDATGITAADWVATWRAASGQVADVRVTASDGWERVAEVREGTGAHEVVVTFRGVDPDWAQPLVAGPLRADAVGSASSFGWADYRDSRYASPFRVTHVDTVQGLVTLERNPLWWGDPPKLETLMFRTVPDEALAAAFQHNELDVWETGISSDRFAQSRAAADTAIRSAPGTSGRTLQLSRAGVLADPALRRAVLMALDRGEVGVSDPPNGADAPREWSNTLMLPTQPGYVDEARATGLDTDPTEAGKLLDEAGWALQSGRRVKDGRPLVLTFPAPGKDERAAAELRDLAAQLDAVGVPLRPVAEGADLTPVSTPVSAFPLAHLPEDATTTPGAADLVERVGQEVDPVRRADQASQLARVLWQDVITIPLYQEQQYVAVRNGLANLGAPAYATTDWEDVGWTA